MNSTRIKIIIYIFFLQVWSSFQNEIETINSIDVNEPDWQSLTKKTKLMDEPCKICEEVIGNIISLRRSNANRDTMKDYLYRLCITYTGYGSEACEGYLRTQLDTILYIIDHRKDLRPARFCAIRFQTYKCVDPEAEPWSIPLPPLPSNIKTRGSSQNSSISAHVLQVTDMHYDPEYLPGSDANCGKPLCCESGVPAKPEEAAGYWADYHVCDMPWHAVENLMERIKEKHKNIDWIYMTGDIVSHKSWTTSISRNTDSIRNMLQMFAKTFPNKTVYPILGNHETHPADYYSPSSVNISLNVSTHWLLDLSAKEWTRWLPSDTQATIKKGGFYTVLVKPGFRIIALNSNVCFTSNLWLVYDDRDPYNQLEWLVGVLEEAEKNGEKVHILSHVPSGHELCHKQWSHEFKKIVLRFSHIIAAQFNGHTHIDELEIFFESPKLDKAVNVAYNGASFATFIGSNPNYRIYEVDTENAMVSNYDEYTFNLTKANQNSSAPEWIKLYSFKEAYGLEDLSLKSLGNLYERMASNNSDNELMDKYYRYMYRDSDIYNNEPCDSKCKQQLVCKIAAVEASDTLLCL